MAIVSFDAATLLSYYSAKLPLSNTQAPAASKTPAETPPWDIRIALPAPEVEDVAARSKDPYFDPNDRSLFGSSTSTANAGSEIEAILNSANSKGAPATDTVSQDNHKLFALYQALNRLDYISKMATRDGTMSGQLSGLDKSFQAGLSQITDYVNSATFSNVTVMNGAKTATTQGTAVVPYAAYNYTGKGVVKDASVFKPMDGVSASDSFTVSVTKGGVKTDVAIDLADVSGDLTVDNIDGYVNQKLSDAGFGTRFTRVQTGGSLEDGTATWGIQINNTGSETVTLSSAQATPAVYVAGTSGATADSQGKLVKLNGLSDTPASVFSANITPDSGTATAKASAVDSDGNVYVLGQSSGSFGSQINQGTQDAYLTKYDSTGKVQWTRLLGSADTASGFGLSVDPTGGVVIAGSVTGKLTPTSVGGGASDSFVAKYDRDGNQTWVRQVAPLSSDSASSVSVDASGNVYVGGQVNGTLAAGQTNAGKTDAYVTKLDNKGKVVFQRQFGTAGNDNVAQTALASDGNLVTASVQDGHAILTKYSSADGTSAPLWQMDLGDLQGGAIGGLSISGDQVYISGTTANAALNAGGAASVAQANSGGTDAFVFKATDSGNTVNANFVSYVGTNGSEQGGGVAVADGKIYLTGTTTGTFDGQVRNVVGAHNMFAAQLSASGTVDWAQQYGGLDGQSVGSSISVDTAGSSVLDALGLPRGKIDVNQSNTIESQTTARPGDYFSLKITTAGGTTRTAKITLSKGETLRSLATKINVALLFDGQAKAAPATGGQALQIAANKGVKIQLVAGDTDFDALKGLGLTEQLLVNDTATTDASKTSATSPATPANPVAAQVIGLGLTGALSLADKTDAAHANVVLQGAMSLVKQAYGSLNTPAGSTAAQPTGPVPAYLQTQLAGYQTALAWLSNM